MDFKMTNDYLFRILLQEDIPTLRSIIASFMRVSESEIEEVLVTNPIIPGENVDDKEIHLDISVIINNRKPIDIEMQTRNITGWVDRSVLYACRGYDSLSRGGDYIDNPGFWQVAFCDFTIFKEHPAFFRTFALISNDKEHVVYNDSLQILNIDLTKIELATEDDRKYGLVDWARLFKAKTWEELKMLAEKNQNINNAISSAWQMTEDERIRDQMRRREENEFLWNYIVNEAERAKEEIKEKDALIRELQEKLDVYESKK